MNPSPGAKDLLAAAAAAGLAMESGQARQLAAYLSLLMTYNRRMNLVGPSDWRTVFDTLVADSVHLASFLPGLGLPAAPRTLDLGAGAGLPGIPLRMFWKVGDYWLVEVRQKRASFMRIALGRLDLERTEVFEGRAEDVPAHLAQRRGDDGLADLVLSRAFMPWRELLGLVRPMLRTGGRVVVLANDPPPDSGAIPAGWSLQACRSYAVPGATRYFWSFGSA